MVCGKCWHVVSGGVVDGDAQHPHYRYGGKSASTLSCKASSSAYFCLDAM